MAKPSYAAPIILAVLLAGLFFYLVMVYPEERAELLQKDEQILIKISDMQFVPESITITTGQTVTWTNYDNTEHIVSGGKFGSGVLAPRGSYSFKFTEPGVYNYNCGLYPGMSGTVVVK